MKYIQLRAFHAVARERGFSRAAEALHVTQPAVTLHVQALEETYGLNFFNREKGGVTLTPDGADLYQLTTRLFAEETDIAEYLGGAAALRHGHLSVAADGPHIALELVSEYRRRHPGVDVRMTLGNADETLAQVLNQSVDVAIFANPPRDKKLHTVPIVRQDMVAIVRADHAWAKRRRIAIADLQDQPVVLRERGSNTRKRLEAMLAKHRVSIAPVMELGSREAMREAVVHGLGIGFMQNREAVGDARTVALVIDELQGTNVDTLVCLKRHAERRAIAALMDVARDLSSITS
jgi:aminoethylphosphonate catabolism LysR family transcriptional regulator